MPSPFPGMDPYLEGELWTSFHTLFAAEVVRELNRKLGPQYVALAEQRFVMLVPGEITVSAADIYPDIGIARKGRGRGRRGAATVLAAPLRLDTVMPTSVPHHWVKILDVARRRLIAVIEFLSPANKRGTERRKYLRKRERVLLSSAHLLEVDLLRKGKRVPMREPLPDAAYFVLLSRAGQRPLSEVWPITLEQPLPVVPVPLADGDADVLLDLQHVLTTVYDEGRYRTLIDYTRPPDVALPKATLAWLKRRLKGR